MSEPISAEARPSRLSPFVHILTLTLVCLAFLSGCLVWLGQTVQERNQSNPGWLHPLLVFHGALNPFLSGLFGLLVAQHIRFGWATKANRVTGSIMEIVFAGLILSAVGLYYAGPELRNIALVIHRVLGLLLPLSLLGHRLGAKHWLQSRPTQK